MPDTWSLSCRGAGRGSSTTATSSDAAVSSVQPSMLQTRLSSHRRCAGNEPAGQDSRVPRPSVC